MAKKRRRPPEPVKRGPALLLVAAAVLVIAVLVIAVLFVPTGAESPEIPDPDRSVMEPQVAAKILNYRKEVEKSPNSHEAWGDFGVVLHAHGLEQDAAVCYQKAIELAPSDFRWHYLLVQAYLAYDRDRALEETATALEVSRDYPALLITRAELLEERDMTEGIAALYERALELDPGNASAELALGRVALHAEDYETARRRLERAAELSPGAGAVHATLARLYRRLGENEKAAEQARQVNAATRTVSFADPIRTLMRQEAVSSTAMLSRARDLVDEGDLSAAEAIYRDMVALRPDDAAMKVRLADVLSLEGRGRTEAKTFYRQALAIKDDDAAAHFGLAAALSYEGAYEEALVHFEKSIAARDDHVPTLVNYANVLGLLGRAAEASAQYATALEIEPDNLAARRSFAEFLFREQRYAVAADQYRQVLAREPELGLVHLQLGASLAATGKYADASSHLERARELGEAVPEAVQARVDRGLGRKP